MAFLKKASLQIETAEISVNTWNNLTKKTNIKTANSNVAFKNIIPNFNPDNYLLTHCTIVASVNVEKSNKPVHFANKEAEKTYDSLVGRYDYYITPDTSKYVNHNGDAWSKELLLSSYKTFIGAENYVEHVQDPSLSKGKILDAVIREVDDGKSLFVDILVATNKKHKDLVEKIQKGELTTLSMGAVVAFTLCSQCGRIALDETETCVHVKHLKREKFLSDTDGKKRVTAELCGHFLYPESNRFIEGSWVEIPAFKGAVLRNELKVESTLEKINISEKLKAAFTSNKDSIKGNKQAKLNIDVEDLPIPSLTSDITEETLPEKESIETPEISMENTPEIEAPSMEEIKDEPVSNENMPDSLKDMGADSIEDEQKLDELAKTPYFDLKEDIKKQIIEEIKREILKDLSINTKKIEPINLNTVNLNDTIIRSNIKKAYTDIKNYGLSNLHRYNYTKGDVLKLAFLSKKYSSISKDIFSLINACTEIKSARKLCKHIESSLNRELTLKERLDIKSLFKDIGLSEYE